MSTEVKPCPFCGLNHCFIDGVYGRHFVQCENTLCNYVSGFRVTESEAIEAHNQLTALREENERLKEEVEHWASGARSLLEWLYNGKIPEIPRPEGEE